MKYLSILLCAFSITACQTKDTGIKDTQSKLTQPDEKPMTSSATTKSLNKSSSKQDLQITSAENIKVTKNRSVGASHTGKYTFDFNHDRLPDKVLLDKKNQQDDRNFDIDIKILENKNGKYEQLTHNDLILKEPINGCNLDGLETLKAQKDTIELTYSTCQDYKFVRRIVNFGYDEKKREFILHKNRSISLSDKNYGEMTMCKVLGKTFSEFKGECN